MKFSFHYAVEGDTVHVLIRGGHGKKYNPSFGKLEMPLKMWEAFCELVQSGSNTSGIEVTFHSRDGETQRRIQEGEGKFDRVANTPEESDEIHDADEKGELKKDPEDG